MNEEPPPLPSLPHEVWAEIFSYLPPATVIQTCAIVCKEWREQVGYTRLAMVTVSDPHILTRHGMERIHTTWPFIVGMQYRNVSPLVDISGLGLCRTHLRELDLSSSGLQEVSALAQCTKLTVLNLAYTRVADLSPLAACSQLRLFSGRSCLFKDISAFANCHSLASLDLQFTPVADLSPLSSCPDLRKLDLRGTPVEDLSPLASCHRLQSIDLSLTHVEDITPLGASAPFLVNLNLYNTPVRNIAVLSLCTKLEKAFFQGCLALEGVLPLKSCLKLKRVDLKNTRVEDHGFFESGHFEALEFLRLPSGDCVILE